MIASELQAKLKHLTLVGQNDDGELLWMGTSGQWADADIYEYLTHRTHEHA